MALHPDHVLDLKKSGLTDTTIKQADIYTVCPGDIPKKLGWNPPQIKSLLAFPYGNGFERYKVFPFFKDKKGHTVKYLQRKGTPAHLYTPPQINGTLQDPNIPLALCEGEKKTLRLIQEGCPALGVGGVWSWSQNGHATPDFERIVWKGRTVRFFPDSDAWQRGNLLKAVYALSKELEKRGAKVVLYKLPGKDEGKTGVDDFLQQGCTTKDLLSLPTTTATGLEFNGMESWHTGREVRKAGDPLAELEAVFKKYFALEDITPLKVILATIVANQADGDPVWLLIVGPPSSLKSEFIQSLRGLVCIYPVSLLTPRTFASGDKTTKDSSLLERLPDKTILTLKDFGSVLTMRRDDRAEVLASLREIYDGSYSKDFGNGKRVTWDGKLGLIAGCTGIIDRYHSVNQILGERFLLYRLEGNNRASVARKALQNAGREKHIRQNISAAIQGFVKTVTPIPTWLLGREYTEKLISLADFVARARTGVLRDGYSREVEYIPQWEGPARLVKQLNRLAYGLSCLTGESSLGPNNYEIIFSVAENSIPRDRREILHSLLNKDAMTTAEEVSRETGIPQAVVYRTLQDLAALRVVRHTKPLYGVAEDIKQLLTLASP